MKLIVGTDSTWSLRACICAQIKDKKQTNQKLTLKKLLKEKSYAGLALLAVFIRHFDSI